MRILLVEDDDFDQLLFKQRLRRVAPDWHLECAGDLASAQHRLATGAFDAVVTDLVLPDGVGRPVIDGLAASGAQNIVVLSGLEDRDAIGPAVIARYDKDNFDAAAMVAAITAMS